MYVIFKHTLTLPHTFSPHCQAGKTPLSGYKVGYRGYPDVAVAGVS